MRLLLWLSLALFGFLLWVQGAAYAAALTALLIGVALLTA
jgi:hypothetical protein